MIAMAEEKENKIPVDFSKMRVGLRMVNDLTIDVGSYNIVMIGMSMCILLMKIKSIRINY